jgi:hypothetical protein
VNSTGCQLCIAALLETLSVRSLGPTLPVNSGHQHNAVLSGTFNAPKPVRACARPMVAVVPVVLFRFVTDDALWNGTRFVSAGRAIDAKEKVP